jgi:hypothetical protein
VEEEDIREMSISSWRALMASLLGIWFRSSGSPSASRVGMVVGDEDEDEGGRKEESDINPISMSSCKVFMASYSEAFRASYSESWS